MTILLILLYPQVVLPLHRAHKSLNMLRAWLQTDLRRCNRITLACTDILRTLIFDFLEIFMKLRIQVLDRCRRPTTVFFTHQSVACRTSHLVIDTILIAVLHTYIDDTPTPLLVCRRKCVQGAAWIVNSRWDRDDICLIFAVFLLIKIDLESHHGRSCIGETIAVGRRRAAHIDHISCNLNAIRGLWSLGRTAVFDK